MLLAVLFLLPLVLRLVVLLAPPILLAPDNFAVSVSSLLIALIVANVLLYALLVLSTEVFMRLFKSKISLKDFTSNVAVLFILAKLLFKAVV